MLWYNVKKTRIKEYMMLNKMSAVKKTIFIDKNNFDVFDTLNESFMNSLPKGTVSDTQENRINAALACVYSLAKQLRRTQNELYELKQANKIKL